MRKLARFAVAKQGIERGSFESIEQLITEGCVADEILSPAKAKPTPRAKPAAGRAGPQR